MTIEAERKRLSQSGILQSLRRSILITELVPVWLSDREGSHDYGFYCALIPSRQIEESLRHLSWDLSHGDGYPGAVQSGKGITSTRYYRFGDDTGIEPLVIDRDFHGLRPDYKEISEEFRLFHRLYHDRKTDQFIKIDDDGNEFLIATVEPNRIQIRLKEIRQFLAIKEMHLAIQFDCREQTTYSLGELGVEKGGGDYREGLLRWGLFYGDLEGLSGKRAFSRLLGKLLIAPLSKDKSGLPGFAEDESKQFIDFIIGINEDGKQIVHTCDPDALANYFGANPEAPHYLTPVHFRKEVLDKYYQQPTKYRITDGLLFCGHLWSMDIDNHHDDRVCAWLGDLGGRLSYEEQLHWRAFNIPPAGGMSQTFVRRQIHAEFTDSDRVEHIFHKNYDDLLKTCEEHLGWPLLLPLAEEDEHHFQGMRIPAGDQQKDFDELVLGLTKILIDSLNEKRLNAIAEANKVVDLKGSIAKLEAALAAKGVTGFEEHIKFLRRLQTLRSTGSAHRKGAKYKDIARYFDVDSQSLKGVFGGILRQAVDVLDYLTEIVRRGELGSVDTL